MVNAYKEVLVKIEDEKRGDERKEEVFVARKRWFSQGTTSSVRGQFFFFFFDT